MKRSNPWSSSKWTVSIFWFVLPEIQTFIKHGGDIRDVGLKTIDTLKTAAPNII